MKTFFLSLSVLSFAFGAQDSAQIRNLENRVSALEQRKGGAGVIRPSAGANLDDDVGISLDAELLIWKAHQTGMNFAQGVVGNFDSSGSPYLKPNFCFDPGVRLDFGVRPSHDDWQMDAVWTFFYNKAKKSYDSSYKYVTPLFETQPSNASLFKTDNVSSIWRNHLNMIDLELSRYSFMSKWVSVKPYIAIRNIWLYQKFNVQSVFENTFYETRMKSDLWAIGPRGGFELKFGMGEGFYFFNNTSAALLWGFFKNNQATYAKSSTLVRQTRPMDIHTSTYNFDIALGLGWDKRFDDNHYRVSIRGAWEHHIFFDTNYFNSTPGANTFYAIDVPNGNYTLEGFTLTFRFDF